MTRDEAIKIVREIYNIDSYAPQFVNRLVALGVLKLDEPRSAMDRVCEAIWKYPGLSNVAPSTVMDALDKAGLKIVEK